MPPAVRPRYSMYVEIRPPNSRHSEPRNSHIASLLLEMPACWRAPVVSRSAVCSGMSVRLVRSSPVSTVGAARLGHPAHRDLVDGLRDGVVRLGRLVAEIGRTVARRLLVEPGLVAFVRHAEATVARSLPGLGLLRVGVVLGALGDRRLEGPAEDGQDEHDGTDDGDDPLVDDAEADDRQREGEHDRPVRRRRQVDVVVGRRLLLGEQLLGRGHLAQVVLVPSPSSSYLRWKNSSRACTVGIASKLCSFGGLVVIHSKLRASHGSSGAAGALRWVCTTLMRNSRTPMARMNGADRGDAGSRSRC